MKKNGRDLLVKGTVLAVLADTQAAHSLGGFKIGVGFSLRRCRNCLATKECYCSKVSLHVTMYISEGSVSHINDVGEVMCVLSSSQRCMLVL